MKSTWCTMGAYSTVGIIPNSGNGITGGALQRLDTQANSHGSAPSNTNSLTPSGCPTIPFNSDMNYPELAKPTKVKEFSDSPGSRGYPHLCPTRLQILGFLRPPPPSGTIIHQNDTQNSGKHCYYYFVVKDTNVQLEETHRAARSGRVLSLAHAPMEPHRYGHQLRNSPNFIVQSFYRTGTID